MIPARTASPELQRLSETPGRARVVVVATSGPSRNVPPGIGDRRSPPCGVLGPGNATSIAPVLRPCLAAPAAGLPNGTSREEPLHQREARLVLDVLDLDAVRAPDEHGERVRGVLDVRDVR